MDLLLPGMGLFVMLVIFLSLFLWIIALIDILRSDFRGGNEKLIWILVVIFAPFLGAILYFIIGRRNKIKTG